MAAHDLCAYHQAVRSDDVAFFSIFIFQQRQTRAAPRIIFNGRHLRFDAMLVPLEIDQPNLLLMPPPDAAARNAPIAIAPAGFLANLDEAFLGAGLSYFIESDHWEFLASTGERCRKNFLH